MQNNPIWAVDPEGLIGGNPDHSNPFFNPTYSVPSVPNVAIPIVPKEFGDLCPAMGGGGAQSAKQGANLSRHLKYSQKYNHPGRFLQNGRVRYYEKLVPAQTPGEMAGVRYVHEFNPATDRSRGWMETIDHSGNIRQVRPQIDGSPKIHYMFDAGGGYTGSW